MSPEEAQQFVPGVALSTKAAVDAAEEANILLGLDSVLHRIAEDDLGTADLLDHITFRHVHEEMYGRVWQWAGRWRVRETNIGIDPQQVPTAVFELLEVTRERLERGWCSPTEAMVRLSYGISQIHPFVNGNGRTARLYPDLVQAFMGDNDFLTWGSATYTDAAVARRRYIIALQTADSGDINPLMEYARS